MNRFSKILCFSAVITAAFTAGADVVYDFSKTAPQNNLFAKSWASNIVDRKIEDGALLGTAKKAPAYFSLVKLDKPLAEVQVLTVELKVTSNAGRIQIFANLGDKSSSYLEQKLICDGEFHTYTFDLGKMSKVKAVGILKNFRLNPVTAPANFAIRSIKLAPQSSK